MQLKTTTKIKYVACLILWAAFAFLAASADTLPLKTYTSADGLGSSYVSHEMLDSRGFLWFCTRDGLSRFDGARFVTYQVGDRSGPPGIESILETSAGIYWITTTVGVYRYDPNAPVPESISKAERPTLNAQFINESRGQLFEDSTGKLWIGGDDLYRVEDSGGTVTFSKSPLNLPQIPNINFGIISMCEGRDGSLWLITNWGLVRRLQDGREIFYTNETPHTDTFSSVIADREGRIWIGRTVGVSVIKPESPQDLDAVPLTVRNLDASEKLQAHSDVQVLLPEKSGEIFKYAELSGFPYGKYLYETEDGHIWISTADSIIEFDGQRFSVHTSGKGLLKGVGQIVEDSSNNLWIALTTGLIRFERHGFTSYDVSDGLNTSSIVAANETYDGKVYAATANFFLSEFEKIGVNTIRPPFPADAGTLWMATSIYQDSKGEWWCLTNEHLYHFAAQSDFKNLAHAPPLAIYDSKNGLDGNQMFRIFEDSDKNIWVSTREPNSENSSLARWDRATQKFYIFSETDGFPRGKSITSMIQDGKGNTWFGAYEGGIFYYSGGHFSTMENPGLSNGIITAMLLDKRGSLWIASALDGLTRVDDPASERSGLEHFTIQNGLSSNNIRSLAADNFGNIYAGTARGIDRLALDSARIRHYSVSDGLAGDFVNAAFKDSRGALWFGTPNGFSRMIPEPDKESTAPPILLGGISVAGEKRPVPELGSTEISGLDLSYTQNNLQIDYFGIDFAPGESLRYQYMLEGADNDWNAPIDQRSVTYANLVSGNYRFLVRAINADGVISKQPAMVTFKITPPFWRRWWFIVLMALFAGAAIFAVVRSRETKRRQVEAAREERLSELQRVRTRIATDLHDDIGSSLTQIAVLSEVARGQASASDDSSTQIPLERIKIVSKDLVAAMSDVVWAINPNKDFLHDLVQRMRRFASDLLTGKGIKFEFHTPEDENNLSLGANIRREVLAIFKEAVNNLVKYSECSRAVIDFRIENNLLVLKINDDGKGFDAEHILSSDFSPEQGGNGLVNIRRRVKDLGGTCEIVSEIGTGTTITLMIPI